MPQLFFILVGLFVTGLLTSIAGQSAVLALMFLAALITYKKNRIRPVFVGADVWILGLFLVVITGAAFIEVLPSDRRLVAVRETRWIFTLYFLSAVMIYLNDKAEKIVKWLFIAATVVSLYSIVQTFTGINLFRSAAYGTTDVAGYKIWRAKAFFGNTMDYSYVMGSVFCVAFATLLVRFYRGRDAWHMMATTAVIGLSLILTFTRGAWVATVVAMCVVMILHNKKMGAWFVGFVIILSGLGIQFNPVIRDRFYSLFGTGDAAVSLSHRKDLFRANWAMFKDHPLLGVGYGQNSKFVQEYHLKVKGSEGFVGNAHNNILQMLAGVGVFGFTFWVLICGYFMWLAFSLWRGARGQNNFVEAFSLGAIGAQVFFHIGGLTQATFFDSEPLNMMLFIWAVLVAHRYKVMAGPSVFYNLRSKQVG